MFKIGIGAHEKFTKAQISAQLLQGVTVNFVGDAGGSFLYDVICEDDKKEKVIKFLKRHFKKEFGIEVKDAQFYRLYPELK